MKFEHKFWVRENGEEGKREANKGSGVEGEGDIYMPLFIPFGQRFFKLAKFKILRRFTYTNIYWTKYSKY